MSSSFKGLTEIRKETEAYRNSTYHKALFLLHTVYRTRNYCGQWYQFYVMMYKNMDFCLTDWTLEIQKHSVRKKMIYKITEYSLSFGKNLSYDYNILQTR
jgi:hypothetical protein